VDEGTFKHVNLNLLIVFAVLMRERSVTRAARRLAISQPAISAALKKLRSLFNDALFTRIAIGITPTRRAHEIHRTLLPSLEIIEGVLRERREKSAKTTCAVNELPRANVPDKSTAVRPRSLAPQKRQNQSAGRYLERRSEERLADD
jgi:LysR family transcriptional regulator, mexEF-oprN operon transcriptional activator